MSKLIVIDAGFITHRSIFLWSSQYKRNLEEGKNDYIVPASYNYLRAIYSILKRIGLNEDDKVLIAKDGRNSWRRAFYPDYKGQRDAGRKEHVHINWGKEYSSIDWLEKRLNNATNWNFVKLEKVYNFADLSLTKEGKELDIQAHNIDYATEYGIEADDIMAVCPKLFPNLEVVLVTIDKDVSQCLYYDNCKMFNPNTKSPTNKSKKGFYVIETDPVGVIQKKVRSGDISDNIIVDKKKDTEKQIEIRELIINMLNMPKWIEDPITDVLLDLDWNKPIDLTKMPFPETLGKEFPKIYNKNQVRTFEESLKNDTITKEKRKAKQREQYKLKKEKVEK